MALGSTSSAEKAGGADTSGIAPLPAVLLASPMLPTGDAAAAEYGMGAELGVCPVLAILAGAAAEAPVFAGAGVELLSGGMALLLTGD